MIKNSHSAALSYAFPKTVPVLVGYLFLGTAYGILMNINGYSVLWAVLLSLLVYAGSLQYVGIHLLVSAVSPLAALLMALMINARHLFYGISMLEKYRSVTKFKPYLIFALTDETFSVLCNEQVPDGINKDWVYLWISLLDQSYWICGTLLGAVLGDFITFDTAGLDFALTALFVVIFTDQWKSQKNHMPALTGIATSIICLVIWGADGFIIPAMISILAVLTIKYMLQKRGNK